MLNLFDGLTTILSWLGTLILVFRGYPQALKSFREGHSKGLSSAMLWLWLLGSALLLPHLFLVQDLAVAAIYMANIVFVVVMLKYLYWPRKNDDPSRDSKSD